EPDQRHECKAVDEQDTPEAGIDRADLLDDDLDIHVADAGAAILLGDEAGREAQLVGLLVRRLDHLEAFLRVRLGIGSLDDWLEHFLGELTGDSPECLLLRGQGEVDRHCSPPLLSIAPDVRLPLARSEGSEPARGLTDVQRSPAPAADREGRAWILVSPMARHHARQRAAVGRVATSVETPWGAPMSERSGPALLRAGPRMWRGVRPSMSRGV